MEEMEVIVQGFSGQHCFSLAKKYLDRELLSLSEDLWIGPHALRTFETELIIWQAQCTNPSGAQL